MKHLARCIFLIMGLALVITPSLATSPAQAGPAPASLPQPARRDDPIASLFPVQGLVQRQSAGDDPADLASWATVTEYILIEEGDHIRTNGAGLAYLTFFEGVETEIGPNTLVVVSTLDLPDAENDSFNISLDVLVGNTLSSVEVVLDTDDRFEIHTPAATAVVRGTRWWTIVGSDGNAIFASEQGVVGIIPHRALPALAAEALADEAEGAEEGQPAVPSIVQFEAAMELRDGMVTSASYRGEVDLLPERFQPPPRPVSAFPMRADCGDGVCRARENVTCPVDCLDAAALPGCGNGVCEPDAGEDLILCTADCGPWRGDSCGDGNCDPAESGLTCPADCEPGQYFGPSIEALCGNGICDPTESALSCPADCHVVSPDGATSEVCAITGDNINIRSGPGEDFAIIGRLDAGVTLIASGQNAAGDWWATEYREQPAWIAQRVVTADGACDVPIVASPAPSPSQPPDDPDAQVPEGEVPPGTWGGCGSCSDCGSYPVEECMVSPEGECLWNPEVCRTQTRDGTGLSVPRRSYACFQDDYFWVPVTYVPPDGRATIDEYGADGGAYAEVYMTQWVSPQEFHIKVHCRPGASGVTDTIHAWIIDTTGARFSTDFAVAIQ